MPRPSEVKPSPLPVGTAVGSFVLGGLHSRDEFSIRYVATASASDGEVLIEEFAPVGISLRDAAGSLGPRSPAHAALWEEGLQAFLQESELLARPLHPALMRVPALWQIRGTALRMWPRFEGRTLAEVCATMTEPPGEDWLRGLVAPLLDALESLHMAGWVHGNVCPGQILVRPDGGPMLLDTAAVNKAIGARMPQHPAWPEPGFRPPELAQPSSEHVPGPWSDLYSLAAVARFCMDAPRAAGGLLMLPGGQRQGHYTTRFVLAFERALAADPRERPQTVAMFRQQLQATEVPTPARNPLHAANPRGLATSDIPLRTIPFPGREPLASGSASIEVERDPALPPAWLEPVDPDPPWARQATRPPRARRWPWALAGVLAVLVCAALVTYRLAGDQAPALAAMAHATLPADQLLARSPPAAGTVGATAPDPAPAPPQTAPPQTMAPQTVAPQTVVPQTPTLPPKPELTNPGQVEPAAVQPARPARPASAAAAVAMRSPVYDTKVAHREAAPDNPEAVCSPRTNFALYRCMKAQCEQSRYYAHPQCVRLRLHDELPT